MGTREAATWVKFFTNAGITAPTNATYAHIFVENRMRMDMLTDLNKEYLREMGISAMGDIISVLRHSKSVTDQSARDKILSVNETRAIAKVMPASIVSLVQPTIPTSIAKARRVLPEHEGKYKIVLPKGSTARSKEILAKRSQMQADKMKKSIFDRLNANSTDSDMEIVDSTTKNEPIVKLSSLSKTSSIFNRLGGKSEVDYKLDAKAMAFSGILKNSPKKSGRGIVKTKLPSQRVMLVKKTPARVLMDTTESDSDGSNQMDSDNGYKSVSFSPEVEVLEIAPRKVTINPKRLNHIKGLQQDGIKARLGSRNVSVSNNTLHQTKKVVKMKPVKQSPAVLKTGMKSDSIRSVSVHNRVDMKSKTSTSQLTNRIQRFTLEAPKANKSVSKKNSVFARLGLNK